MIPNEASCSYIHRHMLPESGNTDIRRNPISPSDEYISWLHRRKKNFTMISKDQSVHSSGNMNPCKDSPYIFREPRKKYQYTESYIVPDIHAIMHDSPIEIRNGMNWTIEEWIQFWRYFISERQEEFSWVNEKAIEWPSVHISSKSRIILSKLLIEILSDECFMDTEWLLKFTHHRIIGCNSTITKDEYFFLSWKKWSPWQPSHDSLQGVKCYKYLSPVKGDSFFIIISIDSFVSLKEWISTKTLQSNPKRSINF